MRVQREDSGCNTSPPPPFLARLQDNKPTEKILIQSIKIVFEISIFLLDYLAVLFCFLNDLQT